MKLTRICRDIAWIPLAVAVLPCTAMASGEIEEVVVTAQKRTSMLQDTPIAITALTADMIEERQIDAMSQVQYLAPNLVFNTLGGTTNLYMRGVGTDINDSLAEPGVALYVDGVYQGVTGDQSAIYNDLERIEVLRGPQGTLYGRNSTGGNVHIYTRRPSFEQLFNASLQVGSHGRVKSALGGQLILSDGVAAMRANVVVDQSDGYRDNLFNGKEIEERDLVSGAVSMLLVPSDTVEAMLRADFSNRKDDTPRWDYIEVVPGSGLNPLMFGGKSAAGTDVRNDGFTELETKMWGASATVRWTIGDTELKSITAYRESDWSGPYDNDGTDISFLQAHPTQTSEQFSQELDLTGVAFDKRLEWIVGLYYFEQDSLAEYTYELAALQGVLEGAFRLPPGGLGDPGLNPVFATRYNGDTPSAIPFNDFHTEQTTSSQAAFAQGTFHLTSDLSATAGLRYTTDKKDIVQSWRTNISPNGCDDLKQDAKWSESTWKLGLDYVPIEDVLVYGSVSRGFKAGGFNGGTCGNEYDPEDLLAYEVGLKSVFADRRVQLNLSAFFYDYDDYQARLFVGGAALIENAVKASVKGAEAEFKILPFDRFEIDGSISWLDGEFDEYLSDNPMTPDSTLIDLEGKQMLRSPDWSYNVGVQYNFNLGARGDLVARYELASKDDYFISIFNDDFSQIDSYTIQNFRLVWSTGDKWQVQAFVENLTDEAYLEALVLTPSVGGSTGMWAHPRTWGLQFSYGAF